MSFPLRENLPDRIYLVTNRALESFFFFRPSDEVNRIVGEWLVRAVHRYGVELYAFVCLSSHYHLIVRCPRGNLDEFMRYFQTYMATLLNVHWGRSETVFPRRYSAEPILDDDALM